jgi:predicted DNA-binding protein
MATTTRPKSTRTISLRLSEELNTILETLAKKASRSKSNYIKWMIQEVDIDQLWKNKIERSRNLGTKAFVDNGLNPDTMTDQDAYNLFKSL